MVPSIIVFKFKFVRFNAARNERLCKVVRNTSVENKINSDKLVQCFIEQGT